MWLAWYTQKIHSIVRVADGSLWLIEVGAAVVVASLHTRCVEEDSSARYVSPLDADTLQYLLLSP